MSALPPLQPHDVVLIVGKRGTGKSTAAKALLASELKRKTRAIVFDYHDEYSRHGEASEQVYLGACRDRMEIDAISLNPDALDDSRLSLSLVPERGPKECAADFEVAADLALDTGGLLFLADEVGVYSDYCGETIDRLVCQSRHSAVPVVLVAQRMIQIPKTARTQATAIVSFRQDNPDDLAALEKIAGKEIAARVSRLPRGKCEVWRDTLN